MSLYSVARCVWHVCLLVSVRDCGVVCCVGVCVGVRVVRFPTAVPAACCSWIWAVVRWGFPCPWMVGALAFSFHLRLRCGGRCGPLSTLVWRLGWSVSPLSLLLALWSLPLPCLVLSSVCVGKGPPGLVWRVIFPRFGWCASSPSSPTGTWGPGVAC